MPKLLSIVAAAEALSISPWTVRKYIRELKIRPVRIGRRVLVEESEVQRFIAANRSGGVQPNEIANQADISPDARSE